MAKTQKLFTGRVNDLEANVFVGEVGRLFYNEPLVPRTAPILRYSDGITPGGIPIFGGTAIPTLSLGYNYPVRLVTESSYTATRDDYYVGVNYLGPATIVLPTGVGEDGDKLIIKDESGQCSANPITLDGNIDNDPGGAILAQDNGAIHMIYRDGWRII